MESDAQRYDFPLTPESTVIDAGGYEGNWSHVMRLSYGCRLVVFEPIQRFHALCASRLAGLPHSLIHGALGGSARFEEMHIQQDSTGVFAGSPLVERVLVHDVLAILAAFQPPAGRLDLLKLNIEGMEYEVLERLLAQGQQEQIEHYLVQFHTCAPDYAKRRADITERLNYTHRCVFCTPYVWEHWERRRT